jgi:nitroimidazol reductase NimA-like FMN-containing flavoprotein (pyridoxamine 5'-phosphate oxidase superfamily)
MKQMTPAAEAMPRTDKGAQATSDAGQSQPLDWAELVSTLSTGGWFWLATVRPDGAPHVMPLFGAWNGSGFFITSKGTTRKSRNLDAEPRCVLSTDTGDLHVVIEGAARHVRDAESLQRASETLRDAYGWVTWVAGDQLDADDGAPTSGGPPYEVFEITPIKAFALPANGETTPTRWSFPVE